MQIESVLLFDPLDDIVVRDPRDEQTEPIVLRLDDRNTDTRCAVRRCSDTRDLGLDLDRDTIRSMRSDVKRIAFENLLI